MSTTEMEKRLSAVEKEVARLKADRSTTGNRRPVDTLEAIHSAFDDDEAFREAMRLGRKWRASQQVNDRKSKAKRK